MAPIRNERDLVVLLLLTFRDITAFKQLIDAEDTKSGMFAISLSSWHSPPLCARHGAKSWRIINVHFISHIGLSKFAKLARSVTRSRQFSAHIPTLKDPSKQSNLAQV